MHLQLLLPLVLLCAIIQCSQCAFFDYEDIRDPLEFLWGRRDPWLSQPNKVCTITLGSELLEGVCSTNVQCALSRGQVGRNSTCGLLSTCCVYTGSCGDTTSAKVSYFKQNNALQVGGICTNTIRLINTNICQLRLDILSLNLANPNAQGVCEQEKFFISTGNAPTICGRNTNQHLYVHLRNLNSRQVDLSVLNQLSTNVWTIKVTQLHCPGTNLFNLRNQLPAIARDYPLLAPESCTQYFRDATGSFRSFGYNVGSTYSRPLRYTICFRRSIENSQCVRFSPIDFTLDVNDFIYAPGLMPVGTNPGQIMQSTTPFLSSTPGPFYIYFEAPDNNIAITSQGFDLRYDTTGASCTI